MIKYLTSFIWIVRHPTNRNRFLNTISKIIWWKVNQMLFKYPVVVNMMEGVKYLAYPNSSFGGLVVYTRLPEYYEMDYFARNIEKGDTVIDVGVHMGDYTLIAASKLKTGRVLAFEPSIEALRVFKENILLNSFANSVEIYPYVASDKDGRVNFFDSSISEVNHIGFDKDMKNTNKIKSVAIDNIISNKKIKNIKFVKIDVEGAELLVLRGLEKSLENHIVKNLLVEVNTDCINYNFTPNETLSYLKSFGYKLWYFDDGGKLKRLHMYDKTKKYINILAKI